MIKRIFDILLAIISLLFLFWLIIIAWLFAIIDTKSSGVFFQKRIGQYGKLFLIYKLRTMHFQTGNISVIGRFLRRFKLDELPQLINVLKGEMSIVGPRPDVKGYYDTLIGEEKNILQLKPGLTSLAAIKYANEDVLLAVQKNPLKYNDTVLFPDKVKMNLDYFYAQSFFGDIEIIVKTVKGLFKTTDYKD